MAYPYNNKNNRNNYQQNKDFGLRRNDRIKAPKIRCIGPNGEQLGIIPTRDALQIAQLKQLDLIEVAPMAKPPVCKIMDYGKFLYDEAKKQKQPKKTDVKEVKLSPHIEDHDLMTKVRQAEMFLYKGDKVKITLQFKGRESDYKEFGFETVNRFISELSGVGMVDSKPNLSGRFINATLTPLPKEKRTLVHNAQD